jgi:hypothetical protein
MLGLAPLQMQPAFRPGGDECLPPSHWQGLPASPKVLCLEESEAVDPVPGHCDKCLKIQELPKVTESFDDVV